MKDYTDRVQEICEAMVADALACLRNGDYLGAQAYHTAAAHLSFSGDCECWFNDTMGIEWFAKEAEKARKHRGDR